MPLRTFVFENLFESSWEGGALYLGATLEALARRPQPPRCLIWGLNNNAAPDGLARWAGVEAVPHRRQGRIGASELLRRVRRRVLGRAWEDPGLSELAGRGVHLWVGFCGFAGLGRERPLLVWYPDFQHRHLPQLFSAQEKEERERQWAFVAQRADGIVVTSKFVAQDALMSPGVKDKLFVLPLPPYLPRAALLLSPEQIRKDYGLPERYFLVSNQFWQHKNHMVVLHALDAIQRAGRKPPVVAFTGRLNDYRTPDFISELLAFIHGHGLHDSCRILGHIPRERQVALIRGATAVIQPSRFEGFGAIALEACTLGVPLLCSDIPANRELQLSAAKFFPPEDPHLLAALLERSYSETRRPPEAVLAAVDQETHSYGETVFAIAEDVISRRGRTA